MKKNINKKYTKLLLRAQNATKRDEAVFLIKKAQKLQSKLELAI